MKNSTQNQVLKNDKRSFTFTNEQIDLIVSNLHEAENLFKTAKKDYYLAWLTFFESFNQLHKDNTQSTVLKNKVMQSCKLTEKGFDNNIARFKRGLKNQLTLSKFESFNQLDTDCKNAESGSYKVLLSGANAGTAKFDTAKNSKVLEEKRVIQATTENEINDLILKAEFKAFAKFVAENNYTKATILKALAQYKG